MATTEIIKVYADGTGDFTSLKTAIDANRQDLVANDKQLVFEASGTLLTSGAYIDLNPYTTNYNTGHYLIIRAKTGEEANGVAGFGTTYSSDTTYVLVARSKHVVIDGIEINGGGMNIHSSSNVIVQNSLIHDVGRSLSVDAGAQFINCILYDCGEKNSSGGNGVYLQRAKMHRCTLVASLDYGGYNSQILSRDSSDADPATQTIHVNETIGGYDNYYLGSGTLSNYNADSEGKAVGVNNFTASLADFVDSSTKNYNLSPTSPLYTAGPSGEPIGAVLSVQQSVTHTVSFANNALSVVMDDANALQGVLCSMTSAMLASTMNSIDASQAILTDVATNSLVPVMVPLQAKQLLSVSVDSNSLSTLIDEFTANATLSVSFESLKLALAVDELILPAAPQVHTVGFEKSLSLITMGLANSVSSINVQFIKANLAIAVGDFSANQSITTVFAANNLAAQSDFVYANQSVLVDFDCVAVNVVMDNFIVIDEFLGEITLKNIMFTLDAATYAAHVEKENYEITIEKEIYQFTLEEESYGVEL